MKDEMIDVYYSIEDDEDNEDDEGGIVVTTTSKDYRDQYNDLDEGDGSHYESIATAMYSLGCIEGMPSAFATHLTEKDLIQKMASEGFNMIRKDDLF